MFDPVVYFFILGAIARLVGSDLAIPQCMYEMLTIYLLIAIGLMGGVELHAWLSLGLVLQAALIMLFGIITTRIAYFILRKFGRYAEGDAKVVAAHYGSVSIGTYAVAVAILQGAGIGYEPYMPLFVAFLEFPAIVYAILLLRKQEKTTRTVWQVVVSCVEEKSVLLLVGSVCIGFLVGKQHMPVLAPLFVSPFKGVLALFMMEMGLLVGDRIPDLKKNWLPIVTLSIITSLVCASLGLALALLLRLSLGGTILLMTLGASASYVAVPAAIRASFPRANVALALTHSLGVTFTFNVLFGIYLYQWIATALHN